ncbi:hypothetical protein [Antarctobacter heliothermus]|uniref:hypothetical protein n=1 Tax=Antarctobacter heliothermus TaxID=74033 RepID=UPI001FE25B59|nr:hypothetical protein [Antarctobacter heliothermus]
MMRGTETKDGKPTLVARAIHSRKFQKLYAEKILGVHQCFTWNDFCAIIAISQPPLSFTQIGKNGDAQTEISSLRQKQVIRLAMFKFFKPKKAIKSELERSPDAEPKSKTPLGTTEGRPLTSKEIDFGYFLFLGRRPSDASIEKSIQEGMDIARLRKVLGNSKDFLRLIKQSNPNILSSDDIVRPKIENTIVHLHIPKTAGTSLNRAIIESCRGWRFILGTRQQCAAQLNAMPDRERAKVDVLTGHISPDIADLLPRPPIFVCMLREAKPRIFSYFKHLKAKPEHPWNKEVSRFGDDFGGFLEFVKTRGAVRAEFDNGQVRQLASDKTANGFGMALLRKGWLRDSSRESSVVAVLHEQTDPAELQDQELAGLQRSAEAARLPDDLVRPGHGLGATADRQARPAAAL